jgi:hypothetical protein
MDRPKGIERQQLVREELPVPVRALECERDFVVDVIPIGPPFSPESVRLHPQASSIARRAVSRMIAAHVRGRYVVRYAFAPQYEVWYWLGAMIAAPTMHADIDASKRGHRADWRRGPGGLGGFLLAMTGIDRNDRGLSYDELAELAYAAERDWAPYAPVTLVQLREVGWTGDRVGGRTRFKDALRRVANTEARCLSITLPRGGRRT